MTEAEIKERITEVFDRAYDLGYLKGHEDAYALWSEESYIQGTIDGIKEGREIGYLEAKDIFEHIR